MASHVKWAVFTSAAVLTVTYLLTLYHRRRKSSVSRSISDKESIPKDNGGGFNKAVVDRLDGEDHLNFKDAEILTNFLAPSVIDEQLRMKVLVTIGNKAAFTYNQNLFREVGCLKRLLALLKSYDLALTVSGGSDRIDSATLRCLLLALNNLALNEANQVELQDCIPILISLTEKFGAGSSVTLAALQVLTNMTTTSSYHSKFANRLKTFCDLATVDTDVSIKLQSLRLLVNLTSTVDIAINLAVEQGLSNFLALLGEDGQPALVLRTLNILVNVHTACRRLDLDDRPPETGNNKDTVFCLTNGHHSQSDVEQVLSMTSCNVKEKTSFDENYLANLRRMLGGLLLCADKDIAGLSFRLVNLLPSSSC